jgi:hypothetical protein
MTRPIFTRSIRIEPGYNHLDEKGPKARGQHGMEIWFILEGPAGAITFSLNTGWAPPKAGVTPLTSYGELPVRHPVDPRLDGAFPLATHVGFHWRSEVNGGEIGPEGPCPYLDGRPACWYDAGYTMADRVLHGFIRRGEPAVWLALLGHYKTRVHEARARAEREKADG